MSAYEYANLAYKTYNSGATFVPVCEKCHRFVKAYKTIMVSEGLGLHPGPNATCSKCGKTRMLFLGFIGYDE